MPHLPTRVQVDRFGYGLPPLHPSAADRAAAEAFILSEYADAPEYLANNRDRLIRCAADAFMLKRINEEHKAALVAARRKAAA